MCLNLFVCFARSVGSAMKEAQYINKSLSALGDVMEALDQKHRHIPYRYVIVININFYFVCLFFSLCVLCSVSVHTVSNMYMCFKCTATRS